MIEALTSYVQWRAQDRVSLKDRAADNLLRDSIAAIDVAGGAVRSFPVRGADAEAMMVAHVVPIRLSARDIFVRCAAALVLNPVTLPQAPPVELVQSLFDLTPADARVARGLASGKTAEDIAADRGTSANTIRTHVRGVLEKNWLQPPNRYRRAFDSNFRDAADAPGLTASFQKIEKMLRASSKLMRRRPQWPVSVLFNRIGLRGSNWAAPQPKDQIEPVLNAIPRPAWECREISFLCFRRSRTNAKDRVPY